MFNNIFFRKRIIVDYDIETFAIYIMCWEPIIWNYIQQIQKNMWKIQSFLYIHR